MADKVSALPGVKIPTGEPNPGLVEALERLVSMAKSGELQSFVGTGFTEAGLRVSIWYTPHPNVYEMLGSISWLEHEYVNRVTQQ